MSVNSHSARHERCICAVLTGEGAGQRSSSSATTPTADVQSHLIAPPFQSHRSSAPLLPAHFMCTLIAALLGVSIGYSGGGGQTGEGQSCDAINICASGTCPTGMTLVAPPERSDVYSIRTGKGNDVDATSYVPGDTISIFIRVEKQRIQKRKVRRCSLLLPLPPPPPASPIACTHAVRSHYLCGAAQRLVALLLRLPSEGLRRPRVCPVRLVATVCAPRRLVPRPDSMH